MPQDDVPAILFSHDGLQLVVAIFRDSCPRPGSKRFMKSLVILRKFVVESYTRTLKREVHALMSRVAEAGI